MSKYLLNCFRSTGLVIEISVNEHLNFVRLNISNVIAYSQRQIQQTLRVCHIFGLEKAVRRMNRKQALVQYE